MVVDGMEELFAFLFMVFAVVGSISFGFALGFGQLLFMGGGSVLGRGAPHICDWRERLLSVEVPSIRKQVVLLTLAVVCLCRTF